MEKTVKWWWAVVVLAAAACWHVTSRVESLMAIVFAVTGVYVILFSRQAERVVFSIVGGTMAAVIAVVYLPATWSTPWYMMAVLGSGLGGGFIARWMCDDARWAVVAGLSSGAALWLGLGWWALAVGAFAGVGAFFLGDKSALLVMPWIGGALVTYGLYTQGVSVTTGIAAAALAAGMGCGWQLGRSSEKWFCKLQIASYVIAAVVHGVWSGMFIFVDSRWYLVLNEVFRLDVGAVIGVVAFVVSGVRWSLLRYSYVKRGAMSVASVVVAVSGVVVADYSLVAVGSICVAIAVDGCNLGMSVVRWAGDIKAKRDGAKQEDELDDDDYENDSVSD